MQQNFTFNKMNTDIADKFLPQGVYRSMRNCRPNNRNKKSSGVVENIESSLAITSISFGENVAYVGGCQDAKRNAIISFYNGDTKFYITSFNTKTNTESFLLKSSLISRVGRITHSLVLDDDLYWIDGVGKIRKVNIGECTGTLNQFLSSELFVDKFPPLKPPVVSALPDDSFDGNNIQNSIFQFAYSYQYNNKENSSWSPFSKSILPASTSNDDTEFYNNAIDITVNRGSDKVKKIYIAYRQGETADWKLYDTLDKAKLNLDDIGDINTDYTYRFYNNKYTAGLTQADVNNYTFNPYYEAEAFAASKDNFLIIGGVKDGLAKSTDAALSLTFSINSEASRHSGYKMGAVHEFGLVFRDENGRTSGVEARTSIEVPLPTSPRIPDGESDTTRNLVGAILAAGRIPAVSIDWTVTGLSPTWAKTVSIVYLGNKTMSSFVDYALTGIKDFGSYTYLDISALNENKDNGSALYPAKPSSIISPYTYTKGDRIRFFTEKTGALLFDQPDHFDYEILGYVKEVTDSAGNILFQNTIYINKFPWNIYTIGKKSMFEIYTPKKDFVDDIFYEIAEVYACDNGTIFTTTGIVYDGDSYSFKRTMPFYTIGELIADKEKVYDYTGKIGFNPQLNVIKQAEDIKPQEYSVNTVAGTFYHNTSGVAKIIQVYGNYEFTSESNDGYWFVIRHRSAGATIQDRILFEEPNHPTNPASDRIVYHNGTISELFTVQNGNYLAVYFDNRDNNSSHLILRTPPTINLSVKISEVGSEDIVVSFVESKNYSDYFDSDEHSLGRPFVELEEDLTLKNDLVITGKYFQNTAINEINKISSLSSKQIPYGFGNLNALRVKGDTLKIFTPSKEISAYLGKESFVDGAGSQQQSITNTPIGDIRPYDSDFGTDNPESLLMTANSIYYYDRKNASIIQTSSNGHFDLAERYGVKTYLREVTERINAATAYNVFIGYNDKNFEVIFCFVMDGVQETLVFNEMDNSFTHYIDLEDADTNAPQGMMNFGESLLVYVDGVAHLNESGSGHGDIIGDHKDASISFVVNESPLSTKVMRKISVQTDSPWNIKVETDESTAYPKGMYTEIRQARLKQKEGIYFSDITRNLKDKNGSLRLTGYANGDEMRGRTAAVTITNTSSDQIRLDAVTVDFVGSSVQ